MKQCSYCLFLSLTVLVVVIGCSNKMPFGGKVTFSDDGTPVTRGAVFFESPTLVGQGKINADGTYAIGTDKMTDGLPAGTYRVYLVGTEQAEIKVVETKDGKGQTEIRTPVIDPKYASAETSGLSVTVGGGTKKFDIQVDRYSGK